MMNYFFTSESVTSGHPDKVADLIADTILDETLKLDPNARVACEVTCTQNKVSIFGEITATHQVDYEKIARDVIISIGYDKDELLFNGHNVVVDVDMNIQSPDIKQGVDNLGAGDQGMMFGFASNETKQMMPLALFYAHELSYHLMRLRKDQILDYLRPDGKTQVTVEYNEEHQVVRIDSVVVSTQHNPNVSQENIRQDLLKHLIYKVLPNHLLDDNTKYYINPTGRFVIGGPAGDSGLTGRKIIVDSYGGYARHGGGAFSGKDPSKVDRSAAYMARYLAKHIVASNLASKVEIQLSYAIGVSQPLSIFIEAFGTNKVELSKIYELIKKHFDLSPQGMIQYLDLKRPIFHLTSNFGHFGKEHDVFSWEKLDKIAIFKEIL